MFKKRMVPALLLAMTGAAHAGLSFGPWGSAGRTESFNSIAGLPTFGLGTSVGLGALLTNERGTITFTYLGSESAYIDSFHLDVNGTALFESNPVGTAVSAFVSGPGLIDFKFQGAPGKYAHNGGVPGFGWALGTSIGLIHANQVTSGAGAGHYQFILGYNDSAGSASLGDWDDFVVGVNFTPAVPEPETYALMLAGLGAVAFMARRRRRDG